MLTVLKVIFRVFLIGFGLLAIGSGGLCVMIGSGARDGVMIALLGLAGVAGGGAMIWWGLSRFKSDSGEGKQQPPSGSQS